MNRELHVVAAPDFFSGVTWVFFSHKVAPVGVEKPACAGVFLAAHGGRQLIFSEREEWEGRESLKNELKENRPLKFMKVL